MVIGTAGHAAICDVTVREIQRVAQDNQDFFDKHEEIIQGILKSTYDRYLPNNVPDRKIYERGISLVFGIYKWEFPRQGSGGEGPQTSILYQSQEEILQPFDHYACAGAGEEIAYYFLDRLYQLKMPLAEARTLLMFIMREAKASVGTVGRETEMFIVGKRGQISKSRFGHSEEDRLPHLAQCMREFWKGQPS